MPAYKTLSFGLIWSDPGSEIEFPDGLPGFEERHRFAAVTFPESAPVIFLQSLEDPGLCFVTLPVTVAHPLYRLRVDPKDLERLGFPVHRQPRLGAEALALAILSIRETGVTANLLAPVVVNLSTGKAIQAVAWNSGYSHQHAITSQEVPACS
jgi:flagellar assembly factor FliW